MHTNSPSVRRAAIDQSTRFLTTKWLVSLVSSARKTAKALKIRTSRLSADRSIEKLSVTLSKPRGQVAKGAMSMGSVARALYYYLEYVSSAPLSSRLLDPSCMVHQFSATKLTNRPHKIHNPRRPSECRGLVVCSHGRGITVGRFFRLMCIDANDGTTQSPQHCSTITQPRRYYLYCQLNRGGLWAAGQLPLHR